MRTVPPLNNSLLKHPGANTPGLFTVFHILTLSQSKSLHCSHNSFFRMHCGKLGEFGGVGNLLIQNFHNGYFLHVWDFSLVEKVEYLGFHIILTKLRSSQSNDDFRGCSGSGTLTARQPSASS